MFEKIHSLLRPNKPDEIIHVSIIDYSTGNRSARQTNTWNGGKRVFRISGITGRFRFPLSPCLWIGIFKAKHRQAGTMLYSTISRNAQTNANSRDPTGGEQGVSGKIFLIRQFNLWLLSDSVYLSPLLSGRETGRMDSLFLVLFFKSILVY